ncbi:hypothetical protein HK101_010069 [Irineochytrium annulatum]|nr:hypothetical protein HK101_010069 [Irineochytrium annulatum]
MEDRVDCVGVVEDDEDAEREETDAEAVKDDREDCEGVEVDDRLEAAVEAVGVVSVGVAWSLLRCEVE